MLDLDRGPMNGECAKCGDPTPNLWCAACVARKSIELKATGILVRIDGLVTRVLPEVQERERFPLAQPVCFGCGAGLKSFDGGRTWLCTRCGYKGD